MTQKSPALNGYSELVAEVNKNLKTMSRTEAIKTAVRTCMNHGSLLSFLKKHSSEIENMLLTEWNFKEALEVAKEEAKEEAEAKGEARLKKVICNMKLKGIHASVIAEVTGLSVAEIEDL